MPTYNDLITEAAAADLIPAKYSTQIIQETVESSVAMRACMRYDMGTKLEKIPVIDALPVAYFGTGPTHLAATSTMEWKNIYLTAEAVTCICPIPNDIADDANVPLWDQVRTRAAEAIGRAVDAAALFSLGKPDTWPEGLAVQALAANNFVTRGTNNAAAGGLEQDLIDMTFKVREHGYKVNTIVADDMFEHPLLSARDTQGRRMIDFGSESPRVLGKPLLFAAPGIFPSGASAAEALCGDKDKAILGYRQDIRYLMLTEGVITDDENNIIFNLPQQRMKALFLYARFGFAVAKNATQKKQKDAVRFPWAVMKRPA